jgi:phosphoenolpyruvate synthase/pyruvate phosphate dikinase
MVPHIHIKDLVSHIRKHEWLIGAVNYDEDLHFSSYYLRASLNIATYPLYPGYTHLISIYQNFNEHYYLLKNECIHTSKKIIEKAESDNDWLHNILEGIKQGCKKLELVFDNSMDWNYFQALSDEELIKLYKKHHEIHSEIYIFARLPEALDRGVSYYTHYLKQLLDNRIGSQKECSEVFDKLTQPVSQSVLSQAIDEYNNLLLFFADSPNLRKILLHSTSKARILFPQSINKTLQIYLDKWKYLNYHGYGKRELVTLPTLIERLAKSLAGSSDRENINFHDQLLRNRDERDNLLDELNFNQTQRKLFKLFPEIGEVKLLRRFIQIRNFYFLDLLISELSRRLNCNEWTIRNMLPEEVLESFNDSKILDKVQSRIDGCVYAVINGKEYILDKKYIVILQKELEKETSEKRDRKILKGVVACRGSIKGTCKIVIRSDSNIDNSFPPGTILVSQSTDPDLLNILKISGAVLTEQGGVTSHAALICRELGIPAIIGIEGLLDHISDGDTLEVDAETGIVKIIESAINTPNFVIDPSDTTFMNKIGKKAERLVTLKKMGYQVPQFILIDSDKIRKIKRKEKSLEIRHFKKWLKIQFDIDEHNKLVLRSSSMDEDTKKCSAAGKYESSLDVTLDSLEKSLETFINKNDKRSDYQYKGAIIVQQMLNPDYSGVCITNDKRISGADNIVIELVCGNNDPLTSGSVCPDRYYVQRKSGDIIKQETKIFQSDKKGFNVRRLAEEFLKIEEAFGCALDIEWALNDEILSILQVRPVV